MKNEKDMNGPNSPKPAPTAPAEKMLRFSHQPPKSEDVFVEAPDVCCSLAASARDTLAPKKLSKRAERIISAGRSSIEKPHF